MFAVRESRIPHAEKDLRAFLDDPDPASGPDLLEELLANLGHEGLDVGPRHEFPAPQPQVVGPDHRPKARTEDPVEREVGLVEGPVEADLEGIAEDIQALGSCQSASSLA